MKNVRRNEQLCCALLWLASLANLSAKAQTFGLSYTTELQTDFRRGTNWVNLLRTSCSLPLTSHLNLEAATLSVAKTSKERLVNDLQTYSNIEEDNLPLTLAVAGLSYHTGASTIFAGIRNLNEDYFTSPCTSLFTNSSCGIYPTISISLPIANYPLASACIDYKLALGHWDIETSLYNGTGYKRFAGHDNLFRVCPRSDGVLSISSLAYHSGESGYYLGFALHHGYPLTSGDGTDETSSIQRQTNALGWAYVEQKLCPGLHLLAQGSWKPTGSTGCRTYAGAGLVFHVKRTEGGLFTNYADCYDRHEWATELTWKCPVNDHLFVQPALHLIRTNGATHAVGLLRLGVAI